MKICDRCGPEPVASANSVVFDSTGEVFDLCNTCTEEVREFISAKKKLTKRKGKRKNVRRDIDAPKASEEGEA